MSKQQKENTDDNNLNEPTWNWTDSYPSGIYKINNDGSKETVDHEESKMESIAAQNKVTDFLNKGTNLKTEEETSEEGFGQPLRHHHKWELKRVHLIIMISLLLLLGIWLL